MMNMKHMMYQYSWSDTNEPNNNNFLGNPIQQD
jgi:hypothetical protein